jgi:hypothetical protein
MPLMTARMTPPIPSSRLECVPTERLGAEIPAARNQRDE